MDNVFFKQLEDELRNKYHSWEGQHQFAGTGDRIARALNEFCWDSSRIESEIDKHFKSEFDCDVDEMLVEGPIDVYTLCPHHLLPCEFVVHVGYVPQKRVLGLSKFARIADALSRRPVIQEMYTNELADLIFSRLQPKGVAVHVTGVHGCMTSRGIRQKAAVSTTALRGLLKDNTEARSEFYKKMEILR